MSGATENLDGSKRDWIHGPAIAEGEWRYGSVSQAEKADANGNPSSGCLRKWHFDKRNGIKEGPTPATERGERCHGETAHFLRTGDRSRLTQLSMAAIGNLPDPGPDLLVEHDIVPRMPDGSSGLAFAKLRAAGVPFTGAIDLIHARPENRGVAEVLETIDEPNVLKVIDHKFPSSLDNAKWGFDLLTRTIQMPGYATWAFLEFPDIERVRLFHNYSPVRGRARLSTCIVDRSQVDREWKRVEVLAVSMRDAAREHDSNKVDANTDACHAFHKNCPALEHCTARARHSLSAAIGRTAADRFINRQRLPVIQTSLGAPQNMSSLIDQLKAKSAALSAAPIPAPVQAAPAVASPSTSVEAEVARLTAEASAARGEVAPAPALTLSGPQPSADAIASMAAAQLLGQIESLGIGSPTLGGELARLIGIARGYPVAIGYAGSGELAGHTLMDPAVLPAALIQVENYVAAKNKAAAETAAADAAKVTAAIVTLRVVPATAPAGPSPSALLPPDAPASTPSLASVKPDEDKTKNKRKKKDAPAPGVPANTAAPMATPQTDGGSAIDFYVDCVRDGVTTTPFWPVVHDVMTFMTSDSNAPDYRCADPDGKYGYARWKGILASCLHEARSNGTIVPGSYSFETNTMSMDIAQLVVETMRVIVAESGGAFIRGTR